jgi:hypothetical protein
MEFVGDALPLSRDGLAAAADPHWRRCQRTVGGDHSRDNGLRLPSRPARTDPLRAAHFQRAHQPSI